MTKKRMGTKRPKAGVSPRRRKSVLKSGMRDNSVEGQTERLSTINLPSFFRRVLGITPDDIRSFQLRKTNSGYRTVYLKDLLAQSSARR
jgi:hypothetical protein